MSAPFTQDDISGSCETAYMFLKRKSSTTSEGDATKKKKNVYYIEKVKDLNTCIGHHNVRSTIDGNSYTRDENDKSQVR